MFEHLKGTKFVQLTRPFLLTVAIAQVCIAFSLLAMSISGIVAQATYATISVGIWAGFVGCMACAWWAYTLSRLTDRSYGLHLVFVVLMGHLAFFILSFFAARSDFIDIQSIMVTCIQNILFQNCSTPIDAVPETHMGRLIIDLHEIVFALAAVALDLVLIVIGSKIRGVRKIVLLKRLNRKSKQSKDDAGASEETNAAIDEKKEAPKLGYGLIVKMLTFSFSLITLSFAFLAIAVEIVGFVIGIRLSILPPGWVLLVLVFMIITKRMQKRKAVWWFKVLLGLFIFSAIANCVSITLAIVSLTVDHKLVVSVFSEHAGLSVCPLSNSSSNYTSLPQAVNMFGLPAYLNASGSVTFNAASEMFSSRHNGSASDTFSAYMGNRLIWKVSLDSLRFLLIFFLLLLNLTKAVGASYYIKAWKKKPKSKPDEIEGQIELPPLINDNDRAKN